MDGIFIPKEFFKIKELNPTECVVLAIYKYYTEKGNNKYCSLKTHQIADLLNVSSRYLKMIKKHLKELGLIRTDGGIKVTYVGLPEVKNSSPQGEVQFTPEVKNSSPQGGSIVHPKGEVQFTHKKEKEEKKEIKKNKKEKMTNFDLLLDNLSNDYLTPEKIEYMKEHYMDRINQFDIDSATLESWIINIKNELNKQYPIEFKIENKESVSNTIDIFDAW